MSTTLLTVLLFMLASSLLPQTEACKRKSETPRTTTKRPPTTESTTSTESPTLTLRGKPTKTSPTMTKRPTTTEKPKTTTTTTPSDCDDPFSPCHRPSLEEEMCGLDNTHAGFFGVEDTRIGEFPFLALLGRENKPDSVSWHCGGSLVNSWYVLTAASCGEVSKVRLGEWKVVDPDYFTPTTSDYAGAGRCYYYNEVSRKKCEGRRHRCSYCEKSDPEIDCDSDKAGKYKLCSKVQEINVAEVKAHPESGRSEHGLALNDVMLVKLSRPAKYNKFVSPLCLPSSDIRRFGEPGTAIFDNNIGLVVGWGRRYDEKEEELRDVSLSRQQKTRLWAVGNSECRARWRERLSYSMTGDIKPDQHLCAAAKKGEDSCSVTDTGGPLMAREDDLSPWQLVGVVSGGRERCEVGVPTVFTRVTQYDQWIRQNMV